MNDALPQHYLIRKKFTETAPASDLFLKELTGEMDLEVNYRTGDSSLRVHRDDVPVITISFHFKNIEELKVFLASINTVTFYRSGVQG